MGVLGLIRWRGLVFGYWLGEEIEVWIIKDEEFEVGWQMTNQIQFVPRC